MVRNFTAENYKSLGKELTNAYKFMWCKMSLKIHILDSHLNFFQTNLGAISEEHGEHWEAMLEQVEMQYVGWLLLDISKGYPPRWNTNVNHQ